MLFDCLSLDGEELISAPLSSRRAALERFHEKDGGPALLLSPKSPSIADARTWLAASGGALDGVVAKRLDDPRRPGERTMLKVKQLRTVDCVVGGFRRTSDGSGVASLLLGLYDDQRLLHDVGFTSAIAVVDRRPSPR